MKQVSPHQMRMSVMSLRNRVDHRKLAIREAEFDLLCEHLDANDKLLAALEDHPDILEMLRERIVAGRRGAH